MPPGPHDAACPLFHLDVSPMKKAFALLFVLAGFASVAAAQEVKGVAEQGEKKASMCVGCHSIPGYQASFPEVHKVPMIAGQNPKYLVNALVAYQKGERKHPSMRAIAQALSPQDMADLAAYYVALAPPSGVKQVASITPSARAAQLLKTGNCAACHGADLNSPIDPSYPKLAGQHADYLYVSVHAYTVEGNALRGRGNAIMAGTAKAATAVAGEREFLAQLRELSAYISKLPGDLRTVPESRFR